MKAGEKVCAVLTAFNRKETTLAALRAYFAQVGVSTLGAVLMDDGSSDGTAEAVMQEFPQVKVLHGDGSLYWNGGMAAAYHEALQTGADYYLWLNDDTLLFPDAVSRLILDAKKVCELGTSIIVGSAKDPETGDFTYGGVRATSAWHPGKFEKIAPKDEPQPCDSMNGNSVLISRKAAELTGEIDSVFSHSMGDYDYALRAVRCGVTVRIGSGFHGTCARNPPGSAWFEKPSISLRYKAVNQPKGLPMKEWAHFLRVHGNITWPLAWLSTYRRIITG